MAHYLSTNMLSEMYGLKAEPLVFNSLEEQGFIIKNLQGQYELTLKGQKYARIENIEEEKNIIWDVNLFPFHILQALKKEIIVSANKFDKFYHMTHIDNLSSILEKGFLSHNHMVSLNYIDISNQDVNRRRDRIEPIFSHSIHDYVPFYFNIRNAMLYSAQKRFGKEIIIFEMNVDICLNKFTLFTDKNASTNDANFYCCINEFINNANFNHIFSTSWIDDNYIKQTMMAELLVLNKVDVSNILAIHCANENIADRVENILKEKNVIVNDVWYHTRYSHIFWSTGD